MFFNMNFFHPSLSIFSGDFVISWRFNLNLYMKPVTWTTPSKEGQLTCHIGALLVVAMWGGSFVATKRVFDSLR